MRIWMSLMSLSITTVYLFFPNTGSLGFLMDEVRLTYRQYAWLIGDHLAWVFFSLGVWIDPKPHKKLMGVYFFLRLMDTIGFVISYDDPLYEQLITFNILKLLLFGGAIILLYGNDGNERLSH